MNGKWILFPQGPPAGKIGHFCKNAQNQVQQPCTDCFVILQKVCKIPEKHFWAKPTSFHPRWTGHVHRPLFGSYRYYWLTTNQKTGRKWGKIGTFSHGGSPGKNGSFLQNGQKSGITSTYGWFPYFTKRMQNSWKTLLGKIGEFSPSAGRSCTPPIFARYFC